MKCCYYSMVWEVGVGVERSEDEALLLQAWWGWEWRGVKMECVVIADMVGVGVGVERSEDGVLLLHGGGGGGEE